MLHTILALMVDSTLDICSKPSCKNIVPNEDRNIHGEKYKKCNSCRTKDSANTAARRKRKREEATEPAPRAAPAQRGLDNQEGNAAATEASAQAQADDTSDDEKSNNVSI